MLLFNRRLRRLVALNLGICLTLVYVIPCAAFACEGAGEELPFSITPIAWSGGGTCPEKEGEVHFAATGKSCEYEIKNESKIEAIEILEGEINRKVAECKETCLQYKMPPANTPECTKKLTVKEGKACFTTLEYAKKPKSTALIGFDIIAAGVVSGKSRQIEVFQVVE